MSEVKIKKVASDGTNMKDRLISVLPLGLVGIVLLMLLPIPPFMMDILLTLSIGVAVGLLIITIQLKSALELSSLPSILLFATLFRLSLNVASTRLILLRGPEGTDAAGQIIRSFGEFLVGGNYVVGGAVFILLIIINFMVITKGSGRVAEVAARFTLDAMPGKQMAIDSDLAAGNIDTETAIQRREDLQQEADFYGAMDGASKFVRGDAVAGLLMTGINIAVGFIVGVAQGDMSWLEAAETYTILSVGDGLVSQIPALLISTAAGVVVTRASSKDELAPEFVKQLGGREKPLMATATVLACVGLIPDMPALPFMSLAALVYYAGKKAGFGQPEATDASGEVIETEEPKTEREKLEDMLPVDLLELEVGFDLVPLVDADRGGELVERIAAIRRNLASELGIIIPSVHIRDNLRLRPGGYRLMLSGNELGDGELRIGKLLAMDPSGTAQPIKGEEVIEPAFGLPARWIDAPKRELAETSGYTVVDSATVAATHVTELLRAASPDLLGRSEAQELVDILARREPKLVDELIPNLLPLGDVIKVMRGLLREGVSVRDLRTVFDALADHARDTKDVGELTELVRQRMARHITGRFRDPQGRVAALVLDPKAEDSFRTGGADASAAQRMLSSLDSEARAFAGITTPPALICAADIRHAVSDFFTRRVPGLSVLSYQEIDAKSTVRTLGVVSS